MLFLNQSYATDLRYLILSCHFTSLDMVWSESSLVSVTSKKVSSLWLFQSRATWPRTSTRAVWCSRTCRWPNVCRRKRTCGPKPRARDSIAACEWPEAWKDCIRNQKDADHVELKGQTVLCCFVKECQLNVKRKVVLFSDLPKLPQMPRCFLFLLSVEISRCAVSGSGWHQT